VVRQATHTALPLTNPAEEEAVGEEEAVAVGPVSCKDPSDLPSLSDWPSLAEPSLSAETSSCAHGSSAHAILKTNHHNPKFTFTANALRRVQTQTFDGRLALIILTTTRSPSRSLFQTLPSNSASNQLRFQTQHMQCDSAKAILPPPPIHTSHTRWS